MSIHIIDKVCECKYCTMIDVMFGDPKLNKWEKEFIKSVCDFGWQSDYTDKQKNKIEQIFNRLSKLYI